jgi:hypothetical protein
MRHVTMSVLSAQQEPYVRTHKLTMPIQRGTRDTHTIFECRANQSGVGITILASAKRNYNHVRTSKPSTLRK